MSVHSFNITVSLMSTQRSSSNLFILVLFDHKLCNLFPKHHLTISQAHSDAPGHRGGGAAELPARGLLQDPAGLEGRGLGVQRENEVKKNSLVDVKEK